MNDFLFGVGMMTVVYCIGTLTLLLAPLSTPYNTYLRCMYEFFHNDKAPRREKNKVTVHLILLLIFLPVVAIISEILFIITGFMFVISIIISVISRSDNSLDRPLDATLYMASIMLYFTIFGVYMNIHQYNKLAV